MAGGNLDRFAAGPLGHAALEIGIDWVGPLTNNVNTLVTQTSLIQQVIDDRRQDHRRGRRVFGIEQPINRNGCGAHAV